MPEFQSVNSQRNNIAIAHPRLKTSYEARSYEGLLWKWELAEFAKY